jgi:hypothetical protein
MAKKTSPGKAADTFRRIALGFPDTEERSHMNHPDFRVAGKIFATLGYPDASRGMVKLTPEQQETFSLHSRQRRLGTQGRHQRLLGKSRCGSSAYRALCGMV